MTMNIDANTAHMTVLRGLAAIGLTGLLAVALDARAHDRPSTAGSGSHSGTDAPADDAHGAIRQAAIAVAEAFSSALKAGDLEQAGDFLAEDVLILENGGSERTREEYLDGHAVHDAAFLKEAHVRLRHRTVRASDHMAWIGSEREIHANHDGKAVTLLSTETLVLGDTPKGWKIVHVHWSSRPAPNQEHHE